MAATVQKFKLIFNVPVSKRKVPCTGCNKQFAAAGLAKHQKKHDIVPAPRRGPTFYCHYHRKNYALGTEKRHYRTHKPQETAPSGKTDIIPPR